MVIGIMMIIFTLALAALYLRTNQARIAEHKIKRMRGVFAAGAGVVHALEEVRKGNDPSGTSAIAIGSGLTGYPSAGIGVDITYDSSDTSGPGGTSPVVATASY